MKIYQTVKAFEKERNTINHDTTVGFVPTMGAFHQGHLALVANAEKYCDIVVVSIFVNPTQFDNPQDLEKYPRQVEKDLEKIKEKSPGTWVIIPSQTEIYGQNPEAEEFDFGNLTETMEGKFRAGHFNGVGTILKKLFGIVRPDHAFFGEKDFQQLQVVRRLVQLTGQPVRVHGVPIVRENNGLALSSRNNQLSPEKRREAGFIFDLLREVKHNFLGGPLREIYAVVEKKVGEHPDFELEYFKIAEEENLQEAQTIETGKKYRAFVAIYVENVRLIDNLGLT